MPDYRSAPMETPEGKGLAKRAWDAYVKSVKLTVFPSVAPFIEPAFEPVARQILEDMIGFWVMWHLYGGFEGLERFGLHKSTIWRKVKRFRQITGVHPDEFVMPGITIDAKAYWEAPGPKASVG
jgi:hypothetical protein